MDGGVDEFSGVSRPAVSRGAHEIYYVTTGEQQPDADFVKVIRGRRWKYMNIAGIELSRYVNQLYRERRIDLALVWASIGFLLRRVPFINLEGGSVYHEIRLFGSRVPLHRRLKFLPGLVHYALPEVVCNRRAAKVVVPSEALKWDLVKLHRLAEAKVVVVPHGVESRHMALYAKKEAGLRPRILFVGRLHFRKGIAELLTEFVRRRDIDAEFWIAGDGPDRGRMERTAMADQRVKMLGQVSPSALDTMLPKTNVFVFPTFYEGFGLALIEAMASGHACVSYDVPVVREVLGDSGVLVPVGDAAALVEEVARLVGKPDVIASYAARAHERAGMFSWEEARVAMDRIIRETATSAR